MKSSRSWICAGLAAVLIGGAACRRTQRFAAAGSRSGRTHYLIDLEHRQDAETRIATSSHLVVFNPGDRDAALNVTAYYDDLEPDHFTLHARSQASSESNSFSWPIHQGGRFALQVESSEPVVCQATIGWTNTNGDYSRGAQTRSPRGARETARSYNAIPELSRDWYYADGIVISGSPDAIWIRESEWALLLNSANASAMVVVAIHDGGSVTEHQVEVAPRRIRRLFMDEIVPHNRHYGVSVASNREIAFQWLRTVHWYETDELMSSWSVPGVPVKGPGSADRP